MSKLIDFVFVYQQIEVENDLDHQLRSKRAICRIGVAWSLNNSLGKFRYWISILMAIRGQLFFSSIARKHNIPSESDSSLMNVEKILIVFVSEGRRGPTNTLLSLSVNTFGKEYSKQKWTAFQLHKLVVTCVKDFLFDSDLNLKKICISIHI